MIKSNDTTKIIGGLLLATAVGGALGILFAPKKGSRMRRKIAREADELTHSMETKFRAFLKEANDEFEKVRGKAMGAVENGITKIEKHKF